MVNKKDGQQSCNLGLNPKWDDFVHRKLSSFNRIHKTKILSQPMKFLGTFFVIPNESLTINLSANARPQ